jgi:hypothetical protein
MLEQKLENIKKEFNANLTHVSKDGTILLVSEIRGGVDLYINPDEFLGYEERYRFINNVVAKKAIYEYDLNNTLKFWSEHKNKGLYVDGSNVYSSSYSSSLDAVVKTLEFNVDWNIDELVKEYS